MSDDDTTRILTRRNSIDDLSSTIPITSRNEQESDSHTKIFRPKSNVDSARQLNDPSLPAKEFSVEPVVGWLVVVDGPGKGMFVKLGYGMNSIGRANDERVSLDFGDDEISRNGHAMLTYDSKGKKFYIQHGGGTNLTYLGDTPVLQPHEIKGREIIGIGKTQLCFIPFCGSDFEW